MVQACERNVTTPAGTNLRVRTVLVQYDRYISRWWYWDHGYRDVSLIGTTLQQSMSINYRFLPGTFQNRGHHRQSLKLPTSCVRHLIGLGSRFVVLLLNERKWALTSHPSFFFGGNGNRNRGTEDDMMIRSDLLDPDKSVIFYEQFSKFGPCLDCCPSSIHAYAKMLSVRMRCTSLHLGANTGRWDD